MNNLYAVHGGESIFTIVKANSKEAAFDIFASNQIEDRIMNEYITEFASSEGLSGEFYEDDKGDLIIGYSDAGPERLQNLSEQEREKYIDSWVKKNINQFWSDEPKFATEYLNELNKAVHSIHYYRPEFSRDFWVNTIKKIIQQGDWYEDFDIIKIDLADRDYQLIYNN